MKKRKVICFVLLFVLLLPTPILASTNERTIIDCVDIIEKSIVELGEYRSNSNYYIGKEIYVYENNIDTLERVCSAKTYPIYRDDDIILLATISSDSLKVSKYSCCDSENDLVIIVDKIAAYVLTESKIESIDCSNTNRLVNTKNIIDNYRNLVNKDICGRISVNPSNYSFLLATSFPLKAQYPYPNGCWAACISAFCKYYRNLNYTSEQIVFPYYGHATPSTVPAKSMAEIETILETGYHFYISSGCPSNKTVSDYISDINDNELYIIGWNNYYNGGHVTCMYNCTLDSMNRFTVYIMDPYGSSSVLSTNATTYSLTSFSSTFPANNKLFGSAYGQYLYESYLKYDGHY